MVKQGKLGSVSSKLTLYVGILIVIILSITSAVAYFGSKENSFRLLKESQFKLMDDTLKTFNIYTGFKRNAMTVLASQIGHLDHLDEDEIYELLEMTLKTAEFGEVFFASEQNAKTYLSNRTSLSLTQLNFKTRPWYEKTKQEGKLIATEPYKNATDGKTVITYTVPVIHNGTFVGIVGGDLNLAAVSDQILMMGRTAESYSQVISPNGDILFHEEEEKILSKTTLSENIANAIKANPHLLDDDNDDTLFYVKGNDGKAQAIMCDLTFNPYFRICTITAESSYSKASNKILFQQVITGLVAIIVALILVRILIARNLYPLNSIQSGLNSFFDFINHKTQDISTISIKTNDEFGQMAAAINDNIKATKEGLDQDKQAVKESVTTVGIVENGDLTARITANPRNPQLIELKSVLNNLLDVLQTKVGKDMNKIHSIFEEFKSLDFR
ncbi:cache domain-containing protein, partial [Campylobacter upsaliensis]